MKEKIVITGMGAVTPVGVGASRYWTNLINGKCGIDRISSFDASELAVQIAAEVRDFRAEDFLPAKLIRESDAFTQYAFAAAAEALSQAGIDRGRQADQYHRFGIVMGTAMSGIDTIAATQEILTNAVHKNVGPRFVPRILGNIAAAQIAIEYGITGPSYTLSTACASGGDAIGMSAMLLLSGEADVMLAAGADSTLCPLVIYSLANAQALSRENDDPSSACRPFDASAKGFVMGEGGGALVLETERHAIERGARIYAELAGWANNNDAHHVTRPIDDGAGSADCMKKALDKAELSPADIDYINAHGTGALKGDAAEAKAMETVFGSEGPAISSTKAATGHMMGGGGITEVIACIKSIETGEIPPTLNLSDPVSGLDFVTDTRRGCRVDAAMSNAFGFGGQNSTIIVKRYE
ncbi:MAG: beta-ketoacyl-[acyl-carrier-protein] synthase family protein [Bacillota bacterium]|nr:beta-ketoacyl-[acyl-carrier-protein] synthase family protein [Bacillota bacterium]